VEGNVIENAVKMIKAKVASWFVPSVASRYCMQYSEEGTGVREGGGDRGEARRDKSCLTREVCPVGAVSSQWLPTMVNIWTGTPIHTREKRGGRVGGGGKGFGGKEAYICNMQSG
jgi:hypothetical protein